MIKDFRPGPDSDQERALESVSALRQNNRDQAGTLAMMSGLNAALSGNDDCPAILAQHAFLASRWSDGHGYGLNGTGGPNLEPVAPEKPAQYAWQRYC